ncbi:hypothetical protein Tco_0891807 [Tanacetum coccineum]|uniref:Uncharacterized protein n=1 Tax=Tanacetum coccineum TaxID=301880 RepID=A0ABQ5C420_9ASTR
MLLIFIIASLLCLHPIYACSPILAILTLVFLSSALMIGDLRIVNWKLGERVEDTEIVRLGVLAGKGVVLFWVTGVKEVSGPDKYFPTKRQKADRLPRGVPVRELLDIVEIRVGYSEWSRETREELSCGEIAGEEKQWGGGFGRWCGACLDLEGGGKRRNNSVSWRGDVAGRWQCEGENVLWVNFDDIVVRWAVDGCFGIRSDWGGTCNCGICVDLYLMFQEHKHWCKDIRGVRCGLVLSVVVCKKGLVIGGVVALAYWVVTGNKTFRKFVEFYVVGVDCEWGGWGSGQEGVTSPGGSPGGPRYIWGRSTYQGTTPRHKDKKSRFKIARIGEQAKLKAKIKTWDSLTQKTHIAFCPSKEAQEKEAKT